MWSSEQKQTGGDSKAGYFSTMFSTSSKAAAPTVDTSAVAGNGIPVSSLTSVKPTIAESVTSEETTYSSAVNPVANSQAELYHQQWNLIREQMSTFSQEVIQMRSEIRSLGAASSQCKQDIADETQRRQELANRLETSVKVLGEEAESIARGLQSEVLDRRETQDRTTREMSGLEERLSRSVQELRRLQESAADGIEVERRERVSGDERIRSTVSELQLALDEEKGQRSQSFDNLDKEVQRLRQALEEEVRKRATTVGEVSAEVRKLADGAEAEARERAVSDNSLRQAVRDANILLEQESKSRTSSVLQLEKNLETALVSLRTSFAEEAAKRRGEMGIVNDALQKVRADLEKEGIERSKNNDYVMQLLAQTRQGLEKEDEQLAKLLSQVRHAIEKESQERLKEQDGMARSAREALLSVENERQERVSADESLRKVLAQLDMHKTGALSDFQEELQRLKTVTDSELKHRSVGTEETKQSCQELRLLLDEQSRALKETEERISNANRDYLKTISDALELETKQRLAGDEEAIRVATNAKQISEKESRDRGFSEEQVSQRLREMSATIDKERGDRELNDSSVRMQLQSFQQGLLTEKKDRTEEEASIRRTLSILDGQVSQQAKDYANVIETEGQERRMINDRVESRHTELRTVMESEARLVKEMGEKLKYLADALETERREREAGDQGAERTLSAEKLERTDEDAALRRSLSGLEVQISQGLKEARILLDGEMAERKAGAEVFEKRINELRGGLDVDRATSAAHLSERLKNLAESHDSLLKERSAGEESYIRRVQDLAAAIDQLRVDREIVDSSMKSQIASCRQELASEREERSAEIAAVRRTHQALEIHHTQMLKDVRLGIETENSERASLAERLERRCAEIRDQADCETLSRTEVVEELERGLRAVRSSLEQEVRGRSEECLQVANGTQRLQDQLEAEAAEHTRVTAEILERMKAAVEAVGREQRERNEAGEEFSRRLQELTSAVEQERAERELGDSQVKAHVTGFRQDLSQEKDERAEELGALRRAMQALEAQEAQHYNDVQLAVQAEGEKRSVLEDRHEKRCRDLGNTMDTESRNRTAELAEIDGGLKTLRHQHEQQTRSRAEEHAQASSNLQHALDKLQHEESERVNLRKLVEELWDKIQTLTEAAALEKKDRAAAGEDLVKRVTEGLGNVEQQKSLLETYDSAMRLGLARSNQDLEAEKEERKAEGAAVRRMIEEVEGTLASFRLALEGATGKHGVQMEQSFETIQQAIERESRIRTDELEKAMTALQQLQAKLTGECEARVSEASVLEERFKSFSDSLGVEAQERVAGDQESARLAMQAQHAAEKETKERQLAQESTSTRLAQLERELKAEREDRASDATHLQSALQRHESTTAELLANIRGTVMSESNERRGDIERLHRLNTETRGLIDPEEPIRVQEKLSKIVEQQVRGISEVHQALQEKHGELHRHVSMSVEDAIEDLRRQAEQEKAQRRSADEELAVRIDKEQTRRAEFSSELLAAIETEATERRASDSQLDQFINTLRNDFDTKAEGHRMALEKNSGSHEELKAALAREAELWSATIEAYGAKHDEAQQRIHTKSLELEKSIRGTIELEVTQLRQVASGLTKAIEQEAKDRERALKTHEDAATSGDKRLEDLLRALDARLQKLIEVAASREAFDTLEERVNEMASALQAEITQAEDRLNEADAALLGPIREELTLAIAEMSKETEDLDKRIKDLGDCCVPNDVFEEEKGEWQKEGNEFRDKLEEFARNLEKAKTDSEEKFKDCTFAWKQEAQRLWEGLDGHTHDVKVEDDLVSNGNYSSVPTPKQVVRDAASMPIMNQAVQYMPQRTMMGPVVASATATSRGNSPIGMIKSAQALSTDQLAGVPSTPSTARRGFAWQGTVAAPPGTGGMQQTNSFSPGGTRIPIEGLTSGDVIQTGSMTLPFHRPSSPTHAVPTWSNVGVKINGQPNSPRTAAQRTPPNPGLSAPGVLAGNARRPQTVSVHSPSGRVGGRTATAECGSAKYGKGPSEKSSKEAALGT